MSLVSFKKLTGRGVTQGQMDAEIADCRETDWKRWTGPQRARWARMMVEVADEWELTVPEVVKTWAKLDVEGMRWR